MLRRTTLVAMAIELAIASAIASSQEPGPKRGERLFVAHCSRCHGIGGTGGEGPSLTLPRLRHAADEEALVSVIQNGIEGTDMPGAWQISEREIRDVASYVLSLGRAEESVLPGSRERGRALFEEKGGCTVCHMVGGEGGILGPDLSEVGLRRGPNHLREALRSPGASVPEEYLLVRAVTRTGKEIRGVRVNEDSFTIQIRDESGRYHSLSKQELGEVEKKFGESLMPSYAAELSQEELEDIVAFLAGLRGEP